MRHYGQEVNMFVSTELGLFEHFTGTWVKAQALDVTE